MNSPDWTGPERGRSASKVLGCVVLLMFLAGCGSSKRIAPVDRNDAIRQEQEIIEEIEHFTEMRRLRGKVE